MYGYGDGTEHQNERMFFRAVEIFAVLSFLMWFCKKAYQHAGSFIAFLAFTALAVWSCYVIPSGNWVFYPLALAAVFFLTRVMRR